MDKNILAKLDIDEQSIENFASTKAEDIVEIDMTTAEYTADSCPMADDSMLSINPTIPNK